MRSSDLRFKMLCVLNMTKQDPALSQDFIAQKRSLTVFCENFAQIAKESISLELNLHGLLTIFGRLEKRRAVCLPPKQGLKMITGQSKAFHLGRWELLFKIMDEGSITRVADIENFSVLSYLEWFPDWKRNWVYNFWNAEENA